MKSIEGSPGCSLECAADARDELQAHNNVQIPKTRALDSAAFRRAHFMQVDL